MNAFIKEQVEAGIDKQTILVRTLKRYPKSNRSNSAYINGIIDEATAPAMKILLDEARNEIEKIKTRLDKLER